MTPRAASILAVFAWLIVCLVGCSSERVSSVDVRIATFNAALSRTPEGALHAALARRDDAKAKLVAEVLQRTRPDIVLLQEVDYDPTGKAYADFQDNYLSVSQNQAQPIQYDHLYAPPVNTGVLAPVDLDGDGKITRPGDCFGFGRFEGHYGMVVLSRYPIDFDNILTMQQLLWRDLPGRRIPPDYYSEAATEHLRLSSKTHAVVPVTVNQRKIRLIISHPTPPIFDGPEDRNGRRNADEIKLVADLIETGFTPGHPGLGDAFWRMHFDLFVVMGDLNADPHDGESMPGAADQLLKHPRVRQDHVPTSKGGAEAARLQAGKNRDHRSDPAADTADFGDAGNAPGNLRVDYVLPSVDLHVLRSGVYWPTTDDPHAYLNKASDHKLVWIDARLSDPAVTD